MEHSQARRYNCVPAADEEAARLAALQYVRKVSGYRKPSVANEAAFAQAVDEVAAATLRMLATLETKAAPRPRELPRQPV